MCLDAQAEHAAAERNHVGQIPLPKPPIGHWMALNLERVGITCKYGTVHMAYLLDRLALGLPSLTPLPHATPSPYYPSVQQVQFLPTTDASKVSLGGIWHSMEHLSPFFPRPALQHCGKLHFQPFPSPTCFNSYVLRHLTTAPGVQAHPGWLKQKVLIGKPCMGVEKAQPWCRHFSLEARPPVVGRTQGVQTDNAHPGEPCNICEAHQMCLPSQTLLLIA